MKLTIHPVLDMQKPFKLCSSFAAGANHHCLFKLPIVVPYIIGNGASPLRWHSCNYRGKCVFVLSFASANCHCVHTLFVMDPCTFSVTPTWWIVVLWMFTVGSATIAYLCTSIPLGHSTVDAPGAWEVWWRFSYEDVRR